MARTGLLATLPGPSVAGADDSPAAIAPGRVHLRVVPDVPDECGSGADLGSAPERPMPRGWLPRLISRAATGAAREAVATATAVVGAQLGLVAAMAGAGARREQPPVLPAHTSSAPPVVLVHGFGASESCWFALRRALAGDGRATLAFNYSPRASSVEELAERLTETVADLLAATGADKVHLVGHSLGGLVIAQALTDQWLARHVDLVVTIGSPFGGSPWADLLPVSSLVRSMRSRSPLLRRLAAAPIPAGVRWLVFASTLDAIVPAERAIPAHPQATRHTIEATGHSGMLLHPDVITRIVAAISWRGALARSAAG
jgi:pimeloyl-ACP methyl ester carboxylesterase